MGGVTDARGTCQCAGGGGRGELGVWGVHGVGGMEVEDLTHVSVKDAVGVLL